jgi:hypothetical protein
MSSFPPVGGTTSRNRFAVTAAQIATLTNGCCAAVTSAASSMGGNRPSLSASAERQPGRQASPGKFANGVAAAAEMQAAA